MRCIIFRFGSSWYAWHLSYICFWVALCHIFISSCLDYSLCWTLGHLGGSSHRSCSKSSDVLLELAQLYCLNLFSLQPLFSWDIPPHPQASCSAASGVPTPFFHIFLIVSLYDLLTISLLFPASLLDWFHTCLLHLIFVFLDFSVEIITGNLWARKQNYTSCIHLFKFSSMSIFKSQSNDTARTTNQNLYVDEQTLERE